MKNTYTEKEVASKLCETVANCEWKFRLFKRSVREIVGDKVYQKICDKYNRSINESRKG